MNDIAISVKNLSKKYRLYDTPSHRLKEALNPFGKKYHRDFWALNDVSFEVKKGGTIGIVGQNGSGKSTLLQIICGILQPTTGTVRVSGKISSILALGAGFNPEYTGRENVYINGAIMGMSREEMDERFPDIEAFAEIGEFIGQPVKTYSSGMYVRLAFACAVSIEPDIFVVDEALAVGDEIFQHRCMRRINEIRGSGATVCFVSHSAAAIRALCNCAILLDYGRLIAEGTPETVMRKYHALCNERKKLTYGSMKDLKAEKELSPSGTGESGETAVFGIPNIDHRLGDGRAEIVGIRLHNALGKETNALKAGEEAVIRMSVAFKEDVESPIAGITVRNALGIDIFATNTYIENVELPAAKKGELYTFAFEFVVPNIAPHHYSVSPAVAEGTMETHVACDWIDNALVFHLHKTDQVIGIAKVPFSIHYSVLKKSGTLTDGI
ncbi:MAG: ABC transporter ATP-binding protein [Nitrospirae bacterium]|nr:ABC transporter ATP-binding protein [Nitrospirota bacterium]